MDEDFADYALEHALKGAHWAEVRLESCTDHALLWKNGVVENVHFGEQEGLSVRVLVDGAMGFAATNIVDRAHVRHVASLAVKMAALQHKKAPIVLSEERAVETRWCVQQKQRFPGVEEKIEALEQIDRGLLSMDTVKGRLYELDDSCVEKLYMNSEGAHISAQIPRLSLFYLITIGVGGDSEQMARQFGAVGGWESLGGWGVEAKIVHDATVLTRLIREGRRPPRGMGDYVLGPYVTGLIAHESCGHPFEADRIQGRESAQAGKSFVTEDMLGTRLGSRAVTIIDDPTIPRSYGFYRYDDEGVKARKRCLMKEGVIASFLHNRETGSLMGDRSNASSRSSSFGVEPIVRMANTYIAPGEYSFEELLEDIHQGVYIASYMEWNIDDTRYNQKYVGSEAYRIEKGELGHLVRQPTLEITTPALYHAIDALGKTVEFSAATCGKGDPMQGIPVWTGGPAARVRNIRMV